MNLKYEPRFAWMVTEGLKRQTIRDELHGGRVGHVLIHYWGLVEIARSDCRNIVEIQIFPSYIYLHHPVKNWESKLEGRNALDVFSRKDGFADWDDLLNWFKTKNGLPSDTNHPYVGYLIMW